MMRDVLPDTCDTDNRFRAPFRFQRNQIHPETIDYIHWNRRAHPTVRMIC